MTQDRKVNLFLLGCQKSGTTSLAQYLSRAPEIHVPKIKEIQFFSNDTYFEKGLAYFHSFFPKNADTHVYLCDASPQYIASISALTRLAAYNPDAKFLLVLRDRHARMLSQYRMMHSRGTEVDDLNTIIARDLHALVQGGISDEISMDENYLHNSLFGALIERALSLLPAENFFVFSQSCFSQPEILSRELSTFLGIDFSPDYLEGQYNTGSDASVSLFSDLIKRFPVAKRIGKVLPEHRRRTLSRSLRFATEVRLKAKAVPTVDEGASLDMELAKQVECVFTADHAVLNRIVLNGQIHTLGLSDLI
mgnify:CR=1 FL=1